MKKYILFFVLACASVVAKAQNGYNFYEFGVGGGVSYMRGFDDLHNQVWHFGGNINVVYNYSPYLPISAEFQFGTIEGGGRVRKIDRFGRYSKNNFKAIVLHGDLQAGEVIDYDDSWFLNRVRNFYLGTGIGAIFNNMADIQRTNLYSEHNVVGSTYGLTGKDKSVNLLIPFRIGYDFKIYDNYDQPRYSITLAWQHNVTFGEGLDGYNDPPAIFKNNAPDQYVHFTVGFKYNFGTTVSYTKLIRNFGY